jgi:cation diffusion facilitator family transporter
MNQGDKIKLTVQRWILFVSVAIFISKIAAYFLTYSVGILSDAMESTINVFTGVMTYFSLKYAQKPRDADHPYGHGKIELITASVEGFLIGIAGFYIIFEAVFRFFQPAEIRNLGIGLLFVFVSGAINLLLAMYSIRAGKKHHSTALIAGGQHLLTDTYTSAGLLTGLALVYWTGINWIDSVVAIFFGLFIWKGAYDILRHTTIGLMDKTDISLLGGLVTSLAGKKKSEWIYGHKLTVLHFGNVIHVDMHLVLPYYFTLQQSLQEVKEVKACMTNHFKKEHIDISIQTEPCHPGMCHRCQVDCPHRQFELNTPMAWDVDELTAGNQFKQS